MKIDAGTRMDPARFYAYAQAHPSAWEHIVGTVATHKYEPYGDGTILRLGRTSDSGPQFVVRFTSITEEKTFLGEAFRDGFFTAIYPPQELIDLIETEDQAKKQAIAERQTQLLRLATEVVRRREEQARQQHEEAEARREFIRLKREYALRENPTESPSSPLFAILLKLEDKEDLDEAEQNWLTQQHVWAPLALHFERQFRKHPTDCWLAVNASKFWQDAHQPDRALSLTEGIATANQRCMAAILTTRGRAFRTKRDLAAAEDHGLRAVVIEKSMYDCNLLGAVYFDKGDYAKGEHFFHEAEALGASPTQIDQEIIGLLQESTDDALQRAVKYLLTKDPSRYSWASRYITAAQ